MRSRRIPLAAYGPVSDATRLLALSLNAVLAAFGRERRMRDLEVEARSGIERTLIDE